MGLEEPARELFSVARLSTLQYVADVKTKISRNK